MTGFGSQIPSLTVLVDNPMGSSGREEPWRHYGGWKCPRCGSGNTILEVYDSTPEGYCMTCTRPIPIPKEKLDAYRNSRPSSQLRP